MLKQGKTTLGTSYSTYRTRFIFFGQAKGDVRPKGGGCVIAHRLYATVVEANLVFARYPGSALECD